MPLDPERLTGMQLYRLTYKVVIFEMNGGNFRLNQSGGHREPTAGWRNDLASLADVGIQVPFVDC